MKRNDRPVRVLARLVFLRFADYSRDAMSIVFHLLIGKVVMPLKALINK